MRKSISLHLIFVSLVLLCIGSFFALKASAATSDNVSGYGWSSNVGWVRFNSCSDPKNAATCGSGPQYGVRLSVTAPGAISGTAWNANIGWISFDATAVAGCPAGFGSCTPSVDWATPNADGSFNVKGWARACSVFVSGCSGALKGEDRFTSGPNNASLGGWDGFIALGDTNTADAVSWGVRVNPVAGTITGFAWGSTVIGWLNFSNVFLGGVPPVLPVNVDLYAVPPLVTPGGSSTLTINATNFAGSVSCTIDNGVGVVPMTSVGGNSWTGNIVASNISSTTTYTATCTGPSGSDSGSAIVTVSTNVAIGASLVANPETIYLGQSSTLTWWSTGATSCTGTNFNTGGATAGILSVSPIVTTPYNIVCTGPGGSADSPETVTVITTPVGPGGPGTPQCSDNVDNADTEDTLIDSADPGCHSDGDPANAASYDPNDADEKDKRKPLFIEF